MTANFGATYFQSMRRAAAAALALLLFAPCSPAKAQDAAEGRDGGGHRYSFVVSPERPRPGDLVQLTLRLEGASASSAEIVELKLDEGLELEAESLRPYSSADSSPQGSARGTELRLEFRARRPGPLGIASLTVEAGGSRFEIGRLAVVPAEPGSTPAKAESPTTTLEKAETPEGADSASAALETESAIARPAPPPAAGSEAAATRRRAAPAWGSGMGKEAALWARGEEGAALALVYGRLRRAPPLSREARDARRTAVSCAEFLGTDAPVLDSTPPPAYCAAAAALATFAALALFLLSRKGGARRPFGRGAATWVLVGLAIVFLGLGLGSAIERRRAYAVVWTDSLKTVPSALSELSVSVVKGSTARLRGRSGDYLSLALADGVEGWASPEAIFFY
jgi:hypothetical protein